MSEKAYDAMKKIFEIAVLVIAVGSILLSEGGRRAQQDNDSKQLEKIEHKLDLFTSENAQDHTAIKIDIKELQTQLRNRAR